MLPQTWNDVSVYQWQQLNELRPEESVLEWRLDILDLLSDLDVDELSAKEVDNLFKQLSFLRKEPHHKYVKTIGELTAKTFKDVRLGEFLDLEHYCQDKVQNITTIAGIFYRKTKENEWGHSVIEPYEYDPIERGEMFYDMPITSIFGLCEEWIKYRNYLINDAYSNLFDQGNITEEELEELSPEERKEVLKDEAEQKRFNRWSWELIIDNFAQGDKTKYKEVYNLKLIFVLNQMSKDAETKQGA